MEHVAFKDSSEFVRRSLTNFSLQAKLLKYLWILSLKVNIGRWKRKKTFVSKRYRSQKRLIMETVEGKCHIIEKIHRIRLKSMYFITPHLSFIYRASWIIMIAWTHLTEPNHVLLHTQRIFVIQDARGNGRSITTTQGRQNNNGPSSK